MEPIPLFIFCSVKLPTPAKSVAASLEEGHCVE